MIAVQPQIKTQRRPRRSIKAMVKAKGGAIWKRQRGTDNANCVSTKKNPHPKKHTIIKMLPIMTGQPTQSAASIAITHRALNIGAIRQAPPRKMKIEVNPAKATPKIVKTRGNAQIGRDVQSHTATWMVKAP